MASLIIVILVLCSLVDMQDAWTPTEEVREFKGFGRVPEARSVGKPKLYNAGQYKIKGQVRSQSFGGLEGEAAELERLKRQVSDISYGKRAMEKDSSLAGNPESSDVHFKLDSKPSMLLSPESSSDNLSPISSASAGRNYGSSSLYTSATAGQNMQILPQNMVIPGLYTSASAGHVLSPFFYFHVPVASFFSSASAGQNPLLTPQTTGSGDTKASDKNSEIPKGSVQDSVALFASANAGSRPIDSGVPAQNSPTPETNLGKIPDESSNKHEKTPVEKSNDSTIYASNTRKHDQPKTDIEMNSTPSLSDTVPIKNRETSFQSTTQTSDDHADAERTLMSNHNLFESETGSKKNGESGVQSTPKASKDHDDEERSLMSNPNSSESETDSKKNGDSGVQSTPQPLKDHADEERLLMSNPNSSASKTRYKKNGDTSVQYTPQTSEVHGEEGRPLKRNPNSSQSKTRSKKIGDPVITPPVLEERLSKRYINSTVSQMGYKKNGDSNVPSATGTIENHREYTLEGESDEFVSYTTVKKNDPAFSVPVTPNYTTEDYYIDDFETITDSLSF